MLSCIKDKQQQKMMKQKEQQFEQLFHSEYGRMYRLAYILLGDEDEAKDAVQDVFASLWDGSITLREESQRSFLLTCVRNRCLNIIAQWERHRKAEKQLATADQLDFPEPWQGRSDDDLLEIILHYIDGWLTPQTSKIIHMHFDDRKSYKEISSSLGISLSAVNKHIVQGMKKLRQTFNRKEA
jgi:RNA polymerase sigma-70 factor (ECF subfamily)